MLFLLQGERHGADDAPPGLLPLEPPPHVIPHGNTLRKMISLRLRGIGPFLIFTDTAAAAPAPT